VPSISTDTSRNYPAAAPSTLQLSGWPREAVAHRDFSPRSFPRLYVLDGGKALAAAVRRHAGEAALDPTLQVHKRRNVIDHLPEEHKPSVKKKLQNAYAMTEYADAKRALERLHRELMETESELRPQPGGRHGRNAHGASSASAGWFWGTKEQGNVVGARLILNPHQKLHSQRPHPKYKSGALPCAPVTSQRFIMRPRMWTRKPTQSKSGAKNLKSLRVFAVPSTTQESGSLAMHTGSPVSSRFAVQVFQQCAASASTMRSR